LERSGGPRYPRPGKRLHENCRRVVGACRWQGRDHLEFFSIASPLHSANCAIQRMSIS
jgi:hypothetical protein